MFVIRLHKTTSVKRKDGKYPIVLQVTWNRKVRRKRLGIYAFEHQLTVYKDLRYKKEKVELSNMTNVREYQKFIDDELCRAKEIYEEHFQGKEFNYKRFIEIFDQKNEQE